MIYALLVGINQYRSDYVLNLSGAERDMNQFQCYLDSRFGVNIDILSLKNHEATREAIIQGFRDHLSHAEKGDIAIFYFSGHGSREYSHTTFRDYQGASLHESLICHDSRTDGKYDLADKELRQLIRKVSERGTEVVIILDCCHSGSATRGLTLKYSPSSSDIRPIDSFLSGSSASGSDPSHILLSACNNTESAYETPGIQSRGLFTSKLLSVLEASSSPPSYHDLLMKCRNLVQQEEPRQIPQLQPYFFHSFKPFLEAQGLPKNSPNYHLNFRNQDWYVNMGSLEGLSKGQNRASQFAIYEERNLEENLGFVEVEEVFLDYSKVKLLGDLHLNPSRQTYVAQPSYLPISPLKIAWSGNQENFEGLKRSSRGKYQMFIEWSKKEDMEEIPSYMKPLYEVWFGPSHYRLLWGDTQQELLQEKIGLQEIVAEGGRTVPMILPLIKHLAFWERIAALENKEHLWGSMLEEQQLIDFWIEMSTPEGILSKSTHPTLDFTPDTGDIPFTIKATRPTHQSLFYQLLYVSRNFGIDRIFSEEVHPMDSSHSTIILYEDSIYMPNLKEEPELHQFTEQFLLIVSRDSPEYFYPELLPLKDFHLLLKRAGSSVHRNLRGNKKNKMGWFTKRIDVKCLREQEKISKERVLLAEGKLTIQGHPHCQARVSLSSSAYHLKQPDVDKLIRRKIRQLGYELIDFSQNRKKETIVELHHIEKVESLMKWPLEIHVQVEMEEFDLLVMMTLNEKRDILVMEVGIRQGDFVVFRLTELPENPSDGRFIVGRSLKLFFAKVPVGLEDPLKKLRQDLNE